MLRTIVVLLLIAVMAALGGCVDTVFNTPDLEGDESDGTCEATVDCDSGEICIRGKCRQYCNEDIPCPEGMICHEEYNGCVYNIDGDDPVDGDIPTDGDTPEDGDNPEDGDTPEDGDNPEDGDTPEDGDVPVCSPDCPDGYRCNEDTGDCEMIEGHCLHEGCPGGYFCDSALGECIAIPGHCAHDPDQCIEGTVCNLGTGDCEADPEIWPGYCRPCFSSSDCENGLCFYNNETQEAYCSSPCAMGGYCPPGGSCIDSDMGPVCNPDEAGCGNPHNIGGSCTQDSDCVEGGRCITEEANGYGYLWPRGHCTVDCETDDDCNNPYTRCYGIKTITGTRRPSTCMHICDNYQSFCREGYSCLGMELRPDDGRICAPEQATQPPER